MTKYIQLEGPIFEHVQSARLFTDSKTFVDSEPKKAPHIIMHSYLQQRDNPSFCLKTFILEHFYCYVSDHLDDKLVITDKVSMKTHITSLWPTFFRQPDKSGSSWTSRISLPYSYVVPGGRFQEIYYWDSYFTAEGLVKDGYTNQVEDLIKIFCYFIKTFGYIPNGNRVYFLSRSQPPFFLFLVQLLGTKKQDIPPQYIDMVRQEYHFWMDESNVAKRDIQHHTIQEGKYILNRYYDSEEIPRSESWREDIDCSKTINNQDVKTFYRHIRSACESGWDFSSRWFRHLYSNGSVDWGSIATTDIIPVDLNALLYAYECFLYKHFPKESLYKQRMNSRFEAFNTLFWNEKEGYYFDYDSIKKQTTPIWSLAGVYSMFVGLCSPTQAQKVAQALENHFLYEGGLVSTRYHTGQQWDYPNGWAPLQWIAIVGLRRYGFNSLAEKIAFSWLKLGNKVYQESGRMVEKYNVCNLSCLAGGGEYKLQDGFGWTNGVASSLIHLYPSLWKKINTL